MRYFLLMDFEITSEHTMLNKNAIQQSARLILFVPEIIEMCHFNDGYIQTSDSLHLKYPRECQVIISYTKQQ